MQRLHRDSCIENSRKRNGTASKDHLQHCCLRYVSTWKMPDSFENASRRFFSVYFRWFWSGLRVFWAIDWLVIAICSLFRPDWVYGALLALPISIVMGLLRKLDIHAACSPALPFASLARLAS